jgi:hypothetical protein
MDRIKHNASQLLFGLICSAAVTFACTPAFGASCTNNETEVTLNLGVNPTADWANISDRIPTEAFGINP